MPDDSAPERDILAKKGASKHVVIFWNPATHEWYCRDCGRTSDHLDIRDARIEIEQFPCLPPAYKVGNCSPGPIE